MRFQGSQVAWHYRKSLLKRPDYEAKMKKKTAQLKDILEN